VFLSSVDNSPISVEFQLNDANPDHLMLTGLFVAVRIIVNPLSNVFQKQLAQRSANPVFMIGVTHAMLSLAMLPLLFGPVKVALGIEFWANMMVCALLAVAGNVLLVYALKSTDLSVLGPINAYKAVISLVLGVFLIGEIPTAMGLAGVVLILAGSYLVVDREPSQPRHHAFVKFFRERGIQLRFAALGLSATEAVFLKKALLLSSPLTTFVWWSILGLPIAATAILLVLRHETGKEITLVQRHWRCYLWLAIMTGLMQLSTLLTFGRLQVGYSLALFQLSTLISVFLGWRIFQEGNIRQRALGTLVMAAGAALIVIRGRS
jgi:drug/metabolite transporter (DMT)-like permease